MSDLRRLAEGAASAQHMRDLIKRRGRNLNGDKLWTDAEVALVRQHYPDTDRLLVLLPDRTRIAIWNAYNRLGMSKRRRAWTMPELTRLCRLFPTVGVEEMLEAFPGRTRKALYRKAQAHGIHRAATFQPTGHAAFDQVKQRCLDLNLSLADMKRNTGCNLRYFEPGRKRTAIAGKTLMKAVTYLGGGHLEVVWDEPLSD